MTQLTLTGAGLGLEDAWRAAHEPDLHLAASPDALDRVRAARGVIDRHLAGSEPVYGVNTGFGKLQGTAIGGSDLERLQVNLVRSHACGVGEPFSAAEARLMMLLRLQVILRGNSGVSVALVERLLAIFNAGVVPVIPEQGSVGASGDLAPLSHMALVVIGDGEAFFGGERLPAAEALSRAGLPTSYTLREKEGIALLNGTQTMTAVGLLTLRRAVRLVQLADIATAMTIDGLHYTSTPFQDRVQTVRPHPGQRMTAHNVRRMMDGSDILQSHPGRHKVQDAYSVRCVPQVHGAIRDALAHVRDVLLREANSTTDNPLVFVEDDAVISGGNFHGQPIAMACDYMAISAAEIASISERRIESLVNPDLSGLPAFLTPRPGVNSGYMMAQVTAAALVSENKTLAHPASVDSIPTSGNQEDHVSMGPIAARKARSIVTNGENVLAVEFLAAAQALEHRRPLRAGHGVEAAHACIRASVPPLEEDRVMANDIQAIAALIRGGELLAAVEAQIGPLAGVDPVDLGGSDTNE